MDERGAIRRCLAGDREAYATIVSAYQRQVLGLCLRMTGSREDAADAAQQCFIQAYCHLHQFNLDQPFRSWLLKIAANECISLLRRRPRQPQPTADERLHALPDESPGVPALVDLLEDRQRVRAAVVALPPHFRQVVLLHYYAGLSYQEIAKHTGLTVGTVGTHLHRAKHLLRRQLTEEVGADGPHAARAASALSGP